MDLVFPSACIYGHLSVAQWLYGLGGVDIHVDNERAFRGACAEGHLAVAQWLYTLGADIHTWNDYALRFACHSCHCGLLVILVIYLLLNGYIA
jgi:hypothetical protein